MTLWKSPWCWERLRAEGEESIRGWDGWMASSTLGDGEGQGGLACCSPWGHKESDTTERLNNNRAPLKNLSVWASLIQPRNQNLWALILWKNAPGRWVLRQSSLRTAGLGELDVQIEEIVSICQSLCGCRKFLAMGLGPSGQSQSLGRKRKSCRRFPVASALRGREWVMEQELGIGEVSNNPASWLHASLSSFNF